MHAVLVANGVLTADARLRALWQGAELRVAADGGARHAREQLGAAPHVVVGDLDSLDDETARWLMEAGAERVVHPPAKDQTDLELAIDLAMARGASRITLLGALGGRLDQTLGNVLLLARTPGVVLADQDCELWVAREDTVIEGQIGETVSLLPLSEEVEGLETEGLLYPLRRETLKRGTTRGISNVLTATRANVRLRQGLVLVVHQFGRA